MRCSRVLYDLLLFCVYIFWTETTRLLSCDQVGRTILQRVNKRKSSGIVIVTYPSRAMEWVNMKQVFQEMMIHFGFS